MNVISINPGMRVAEVNRIARAQGCRVRLIKIDSHMNSAFTAIDHGQHQIALEHIRSASAMLDEQEAACSPA
ncbi:MAG TPA: hypothetical protein VK149_03565 [Sideroxyarcus sp.]|nr:hypothetical protein [Sideroxyarcus sp.]